MLRFNEATRQSVMRLHDGRSAGSGMGDGGSSADGNVDSSSGSSGGEHERLVADPRCLGFEYTKTMAAAGTGTQGALML